MAPATQRRLIRLALAVVALPFAVLGGVFAMFVCQYGWSLWRADFAVRLEPANPLFWIGLAWLILTVLPAALPLILYAEFARVRRVLFYGIAGGFCGYVGHLIAKMQGAAGIPEWWPILTGVLGGVVFWALIGRRAGPDYWKPASERP